MTTEFVIRWALGAAAHDSLGSALWCVLARFPLMLPIINLTVFGLLVDGCIHVSDGGRKKQSSREEA